MPWRERSPVDLRVQFIGEYQTELWSMTELAEQYGISRKTAYKWVARYERGGAAALLDQSRRPWTQPTATDPRWSTALLAVRRRHPRWGAKKLLAVVRRQDARAAWPSRSTCVMCCAGTDWWCRARGGGAMPHGGHALAPDHRAERDVDDRLQRRVSHRRSALLLSADAARRVQSVRAAL